MRPDPAASPAPSYLALGVTVVTLALAYGVWYAYSVFLVALLREFGWSRSVLAGAFSIFTLVSGGAGPVLGALADRFGPRRLILTGGVLLAGSLWADSLVTRAWHLYVTFGLLTAVGVATAGWTPAVVMVQRQWKARLGLALGIAGSGVGLGIFLVVPLCQALIDGFGWRWAFRALAVLCALWILPATFLAIRDTPPSPREPAARGLAGTAPAGEHSLWLALANPSFRLIGLAVFLGSICSQTLHVHQAAFLVDHGLPAMTAASVISVVGASSIVGKTGGGWISDHLSRELVYALGMIGMIFGVGVLWLVALAPTAWLALGYAVLFGVGYSVTAFIVPAMMSDRFRGPNFGSIFGATQVASALGSALGAWMAGRIFDATGATRSRSRWPPGRPEWPRSRCGRGGCAGRRGPRDCCSRRARARRRRRPTSGARAARGRAAGGGWWRRGLPRTGRARGRGPRARERGPARGPRRGAPA